MVLCRFTLTLDLSSATNAVQPVRIRLGQVLVIGGTSGCTPWSFAAASSVRPILEQIDRHAVPANNQFGQGDADVEYRATRTGTVRIDLCIRICPPGFARTAVVTVIPAESSAEIARRGTGTVTLTASPFAGVHPLHVNCPQQLVVDGQYAPKIPFFSFTVAGVAYQGGVAGPRFGDDVMFGTGPFLSHDYRTAGARTLILDDAGGALTNSPLKTVDPADIDVLRLDAGTMSLTWHC